MPDVKGALSVSGRRGLRASIAETKDPFINAIPKVELHVHLEGCITPELRWKFTQRNGEKIMNRRTGEPFASLEELRDASDTLKPHADGGMTNEEETLSFFDALYGGFESLKTVQDHYDLAMHYFENAARMNVRYCEIFFDPQGHTRCGITWDTMMTGFRQAQKKAEKDLNVSASQDPICA
jgi:adenosine deaminase